MAPMLLHIASTSRPTRSLERYGVVATLTAQQVSLLELSTLGGETEEDGAHVARSRYAARHDSIDSMGACKRIKEDTV